MVHLPFKHHESTLPTGFKIIIMFIYLLLFFFLGGGGGGVNAVEEHTIISGAPFQDCESGSIKFHKYGG